MVAVTGSTERARRRRDVYVGTEAVLHRVRSADVVAFLDLDAELLAPRYRAAEQAMALLVRAAAAGRRRVPAAGGCSCRRSCRATRCSQAVLHADPSRRRPGRSWRRRELLGLPPFAALAAIEGAGAGVRRRTGLEVADGGRPSSCAPRLDDARPRLAPTPRPKGSRLRIDVDPPR